MVQPILHFILGALSVALLVLLAAPGRRRSVERAARARLEAGLPMSLDEIEAGKDALRAEFAAAAARFEQEAKHLREERNEQAIAAGRAQEEAREAQAQSGALRESLAALEGEGAALRAGLAQAEQGARSLEAQLSAQERLMAEARTETHRLEKRFEEASFLASSRQIELVGRESEAERLGDELRGARDKAVALEREFDALRTSLDADRGRAGEAAARTVMLQAELLAARDRAAHAAGEAERARRDRALSEQERQRLGAELVEARKERMEVEVEFAGLNRLLVSLFPSAAAGGGPARALEAAATERDRLEARVAALLRETRKLHAALARTPRAGDNTPEAALREQMLDLAAKVAAMTVRTEGPGGPTNEALEKGRTDAAAPASSLADRIRALRRHS